MRSQTEIIDALTRLMPEVCSNDQARTFAIAISYCGTRRCGPREFTALRAIPYQGRISAGVQARMEVAIEAAIRWLQGADVPVEQIIGRSGAAKRGFAGLGEIPYPRSRTHQSGEFSGYVEQRPNGVYLVIFKGHSRYTTERAMPPYHTMEDAERVLQGRVRRLSFQVRR